MAPLISVLRWGSLSTPLPPDEQVVSDRAFLFGGLNTDPAVVGTVERYIYTPESRVPITGLDTARSHAGVGSNATRAVVFGGFLNMLTSDAVTLRIFSDESQLTQTSMLIPRATVGVASNPSRAVLYGGIGNTGGGGITNERYERELYNLSDLSRNYQSALSPMRGFVAAIGNELGARLFGGQGNAAAYITVQKHDYSDESMTSLTALSAGRKAIATVGDNTYAVLFGGMNSSGVLSTTVERHRYADDTRITATSLGVARAEFNGASNNVTGILPGGSIAGTYTDAFDKYSLYDGSIVPGTNLGVGLAGIAVGSNAHGGLVPVTFNAIGVLMNGDGMGSRTAFFFADGSRATWSYATINRSRGGAVGSLDAGYVFGRLNKTEDQTVEKTTWADLSSVLSTHLTNDYMDHSAVGNKRYGLSTGGYDTSSGTLNGLTAVDKLTYSDDSLVAGTVMSVGQARHSSAGNDTYGWLQGNSTSGYTTHQRVEIDTETWSVRTALAAGRMWGVAASGVSKLVTFGSAVINTGACDKMVMADETRSVMSNLSTGRYGMGVVTDCIKALLLGGYNGSAFATVEEYNFADDSRVASTALIQETRYNTAHSNAHGGLI